MLRTHFVGRQSLQLAQVEGVRAEWLGGSALPLAGAEIDPSAEIPGLDARAPKAWSRLRQSGWRFSRREAGPQALPPATEFKGTVLISPQGLPLIAPGFLVLRLADNSNPNRVANLAQTLGFRVIRALSFTAEQRIYLIESTSPGVDVLDLSPRLLEFQDVLYAEAELVSHIEERTIPSDPKLDEQWQHTIVGMPAAWNHAQGSGIRIGIIDTGFHATHPDLKDGIDRHAAGFYAMNSNGPLFQAKFSKIPKSEHGTQCAGMAAARTNGIDGCGSAPCSTLVPVAVPKATSQLAMALAIGYLTDPSREVTTNPPSGVHVLSCSLGLPWQNLPLASVMDDALSFAAEQGRGGLGIPIFWATDNTQVSTSGDPFTSHKHTIGIGLSNEKDLGGFSAFGAGLDLLAPGVAVRTTSGKSGFTAVRGTSMATAYVAGIAALILELRPSLATDEVRDLLTGSCKQIAPSTAAGIRTDSHGFGRLQADVAIDTAMNLPPP